MPFLCCTHKLGQFTKGYVVYQKKGSGEFKKVATVKNGSLVSYTRIGLSSATKYSYKIKAYKIIKGKTAYSGYSKTKYTYTKPSTPKLTSAKAASSTSIKLSWKKVSRAKGYIIYRKSGSSYKKVATVRSGSKTSYTVKNLTKGKKYTFAVKAYIKNGNKTIYSSRSSTKSATPKHIHKYEDYVCSCGAVDTANAYEYLKEWLLENGEVDGSFVSIYEQDGNYNNTSYSLNYNASTDYLYVTQGYFNAYNEDEYVWTKIQLDNYEFILSVAEDDENMYRDFVEGTLNATTFTDTTPLRVTDYNETDFSYNTMTSEARISVCEILTWFDNFLYENNLGITIADLGFESF